MTATHVTAAHVGRIYVEDTESIDLATGRRHEGTARYLICAVQPADTSYYRTCPEAGPRVECVVTRLRPGRPKPTVAEVLARPKWQQARRWLPTTGNAKRVEVKAR